LQLARDYCSVCRTRFKKRCLQKVMRSAIDFGFARWGNL
jgi:hypothetical protein